MTGIFEAISRTMHCYLEPFPGVFNRLLSCHPDNICRDTLRNFSSSPSQFCRLLKRQKAYSRCFFFRLYLAVILQATYRYAYSQQGETCFAFYSRWKPFLMVIVPSIPPPSLPPPPPQIHVCRPKRSLYSVWSTLKFYCVFPPLLRHTDTHKPHGFLHPDGDSSPASLCVGSLWSEAFSLRLDGMSRHHECGGHHPTHLRDLMLIAAIDFGKIRVLPVSVVHDYVRLFRCVYT